MKGTHLTMTCTHLPGLHELDSSDLGIRLSVCCGGETLGASLSKQRLAHWVEYIITSAYRLAGHQTPAVTCHFPRSISSSWWANPTGFCCCYLAITFSRFYRINIAPSRVNSFLATLSVSLMVSRFLITHWCKGYPGGKTPPPGSLSLGNLSQAQ